VGRYKWIKGKELSVLPRMGGEVNPWYWYKVVSDHDRVFGSFYRVVDVLPVDFGHGHLDMVEYVKDEKGGRIGVFVASEGRVGWSKVHPKDFTGCLNWRLAKEIALSRARSFSGATAHEIDASVPRKFRGIFVGFVVKYTVRLNSRKVFDKVPK